MRYFVAYILPGFTILLSVPLILGLVPPNGLYGFRTGKTLSSPEIWYAANRAAGWIMLAASLVAVGFNLILPHLWPDLPQRKQLVWMALSYPPVLVIALVCSLLYLRRL